MPGSSGLRVTGPAMIAQLTAAIRTSFADSDRTYGARRVRRDLRAWGHRCGIHRVQRLMRGAQLVARPRRRRLPCDTGIRPEHAVAPNLLDRQFGAMAPNCKWAADFTYLWTARGLAVRGGGAGSVLAPRGGLVDELADDRAVRHRRHADGDLAARPQERLAASLGPGQPIHQ